MGRTSGAASLPLAGVFLHVLRLADFTVTLTPASFTASVAADVGHTSLPGLFLHTLRLAALSRPPRPGLHGSGHCDGAGTSPVKRGVMV